MSSDKHISGVDDATAIEDADVAVAEATVPYADHLAVELLGELSDFTDQEPLYAATGAVIAVGLVLRDAKTIRAGTRMLASHLLATALRGVVKHLVDRTRPDAAVRNGHYHMGSGERYERDFNSFPSGHTAGAVAVARAFSREYPRQAPLALASAAASGAAQVIRCSHYPSDVVVGAGIGALAEVGIDRLMRWSSRY
ncbi:phosphatase PAP2 family protein [Sphingomonas arenae]|uniref:phosphatase PAP2 family protein n=1 Tax=Sphingomonas arenae TaxID=2812555 RepID=UPI001968557D|nr:phosphatase PAP2 family protein [Sphingomonas arenae]